jgi:hypothetical protein
MNREISVFLSLWSSAHAPEAKLDSWAIVEKPSKSPWTLGTDIAHVSLRETRAYSA